MRGVVPQTWLFAGIAVVGVAALFAASSIVLVGHATKAPILLFAFAALWLAVGCAFACFVASRLGARPSYDGVTDTPAQLLLWIFAVGLAARFVLLASAPVLEVDFNRYLWDGALAAHGYNPYALSPRDVALLSYDDPRLELAKAAGDVFEAISYPELKTIYPPGAQVAFALAHWLSPFSLTAWRLIAIAADVATFACLVTLLRTLARPPEWAAFYWWSPLVLKELINSAHLEAVLIPLVLASILASVRRRPMLAACCLGLAASVKLWPLVLAPLLLRPLLDAARRTELLRAVAMLALFVTATAAPVALGGIDRNSGFIAFAEHWSTNSAHLPALEQLLRKLFRWTNAADPTAGRLARTICALLLIAVAVGVARKPAVTPRDLIARAYVVTAAVVLLSPAQFPWYVVWVLPLAILHQGLGWHVAAATTSLYYVTFYTRAIGWPEAHRTVTVWVIWLPVWLLLVRDVWRDVLRRRTQQTMGTSGFGGGHLPARWFRR